MLETRFGRIDTEQTETDESLDLADVPSADLDATLLGMSTVGGADEETPAWLTALAAAGGIVVGVGVGVSSWWHLDAGWVGSMVLGLGILVALTFAIRAGHTLGVRPGR